MNTAKKLLLKLIEEITESQIPEIIDFIGFLKSKKENQVYKDLELASVWNNVWTGIISLKGEPQVY